MMLHDAQISFEVHGSIGTQQGGQPADQGHARAQVGSYQYADPASNQVLQIGQLPARRRYHEVGARREGPFKVFLHRHG